MTPSSEFSASCTPTFMDGSLWVANAIADCLLVYRGSSCIEEHAEDFFLPHDWRGQMQANRAGGRLVLTMDPDSSSVAGTQWGVERAVAWARRTRAPRLLLLSELSRYPLMGEDLAQSAALLREQTGLPCVAAGASTLDRDYTHAVRSLLRGLAEEVRRVGGGEPEPETVGVVGYLRSRNEGDGEGDVLELRRMVAALGLSLPSLWLSGAGWAELAAIRKSSTLVALPSGREAAGILGAERGVEVVDAALPLSLGGTADWIRRLGEGTGRLEAAEDFIDRELRAVVPQLDPVASRFLRARRVLVAAPWDWAPGIARCLREDLGMDVVATVLRHRSVSAYATPLGDEHGDGQLDPTVASLNASVSRARAEGGLDLVVGSAWEQAALEAEHGDIPVLEFGYPQRRAHFLAPTPHLGFRGVLTWAQRAYEALFR